jgi:hypothetical protein
VAGTVSILIRIGILAIISHIDSMRRRSAFAAPKSTLLTPTTIRLPSPHSSRHGAASRASQLSRRSTMSNSGTRQKCRSVVISSSWKARVTPVIFVSIASPEWRLCHLVYELLSRLPYCPSALELDVPPESYKFLDSRIFGMLAVQPRSPPVYYSSTDPYQSPIN